MWPYGASPFAIRCAPMTPAYPTSMTFDVSTLSPIRNPVRNTAAATSSHTGHTCRTGRVRFVAPIHVIRAIT